MKKKAHDFLISVAKRSPGFLTNWIVDMVCPRLLSHIVMDIASSCNANCPYCPRSKNRDVNGLMSQSVFDTLVSQIERLPEIRTISLYAFGEPLLNPCAGKYIERLSILDRKLILSTNTTNIDRFADSLMHLDLLQFSVEGHDKKSYEENRRNLKFEETLERLRCLDGLVRARRKNGMKTPFRQIHCLVTKKTMLKEFVSCWSPYVDEIRFSMLGPHLDWDEQGNARFKYPNELSRECFDFSVPSNKKECEYVSRAVTFNSDGRAVLCCSDFGQFLELGDYRDIVGVFNNALYVKLHRDIALGKKNMCDGCRVFWKYSKEEVCVWFPELPDLQKCAHPGVKIVVGGLL